MALFITPEKIIDISQVKAGDFHSHYLNAVAEIIEKWLNKEKSFDLNTSGSTGKPKRIKFKRNQILTSALQTLNYFKLTDRDIFHLALPVGFVAGFMMVIRALVAGADLIAEKPSSRLKFHIKGYTPAFTALTPYQFLQCIKNQLTYPFLNQVQTILLGGDKLPPSFSIPKSFKPMVYHTYGMTETLTHVAVRKINPAPPEKEFKAMPGVEFAVDDLNRLMIRCPIWPNEKLITNDCVELIDNYHFVYKGRFDDVIVSGGIKIFPHELEEKLSSILEKYLGQVNYFVTGKKDLLLGEKCILLIESITPDKKLIDNIEQEIQNQIEPYRRPREIIFLSSFEYKSSGKTDKRATLAKAEKQ